MDERKTVAPPVVVAMVVHDPGDLKTSWFPEVLSSLQAQDYPSLQTLFLVTEGEWTAPVTAAIMEVLPDAVVRSVVGNTGYGRTVNQVLRLVEGDNGFFLLMHDDVALDPTAVSELVAELYRSNAGVVGPKLVNWDDPTMLQHVGYGMDVTGELDPVIEWGEKDQEQQDAVADVFVLPSACLLVRADLFRALNGFSEEIDFIGDDLDLCWRTHITGARVVVVPAARARHRESFATRVASFDRQKVAIRNRVNTVAALTGGARLPLVLLRMFVLALIEFFLGLFTGSTRRARLILGGLVTLPLHAGSVARRRRAVKLHRRVPDHEIHELQIRGSARWRVFMRHRVATGHVDLSVSGIADMAGDVQDRSRAEVLAMPRPVTVMWLSLVVLLIVGSRGIIGSGVTSINQFLPFGGGPRTLLREHLSGWWSIGFGSSTPGPTGILMVAVAGLFTLGRMALLQTLSVVGLLFVGPIGMWKLSNSFGEYKSRVAATLVYAAVPLPYAAVASGQWNVLAMYAVLPIVAYYSQQPISWRNSIKVGIIMSALMAFVPVGGVLIAVGFFAWGIVSRLAGGSSGESAQYMRMGVVSIIAPLILLMPWSFHYFTTDGWNLVNGSTSSGEQLGVAQLARFGIGSTNLGHLAWFFYLPILPAVLLSSGRRFDWVVKAVWWMFLFGGLAVASDNGFGDGLLPDSQLMLPFLACGLSIAAAVAISVASNDVRQARLGWRQPVAALTFVGLVIGVVPLAANAIDGRWNQRSLSLTQLLAQIPTNSPSGDSRVLFLGDARVLPLGSAPLAGKSLPGEVSYAVTDDRPLAIRNHWRAPQSLPTDATTEAIKFIVEGKTVRGGRLLAPLGIRYVVVPIIDGGRSTRSDPIPAPDGLIRSLGEQLDFRRQYQASDLVIFENTAWLPVASLLAEPATTASQEAGPVALAQIDFFAARKSGRQLFNGFTANASKESKVIAGTVHVAFPLDNHWKLRVGGISQTPRLAFGSTTAYQMSTGGTVQISYQTSNLYRLLLAMQIVLWAGCFIYIFDLKRVVPRRKRGALFDDSPVITFATDAITEDVEG